MADSHAQFSGNIPEIYDQHLGPAFFKSPAEDTARRVAEALAGVAHARVLEVACGTGIVTEALRGALGAEVEIVATDLNPAMLEYAQSVRGGLANVTWQQADAQALGESAGMDDASFDAVVCQFGVMFLPDKPKGMAEMARVLKPGGTLVVSTWESLAKNTLPGLGQKILENFFSADPPMFLSIPFGMHDHGAIAALFEGAGLGAPAIEAVSFEYECPEARDLAIGLITGNPGIHEINERATAPADTIIDAVTEALAAEFGDNPLRATAHTIIASAVRG